MRYGVDQDFYRNTYGGVPFENFSRAVTQAEHAVDRACSYRIGDIEDWPPFAQEQIRLAVCAQADYIQMMGDFGGLAGTIGSYSIGDVTVSLGGDGASDQLSKHFDLCPEAVKFLMPTGLLDRRLR